MKAIRLPVSLLNLLVTIFIGYVLTGCSQIEPEPIRYGVDNCAYCRMTIVENQFGSELVTQKRKVYKFDSIECLAAFYRRGDVAADHVHSMWVTDFLAPESLIAVPDATFVHAKAGRSPMGMGLFGFRDRTAAETFAPGHEGRLLPWPELVDVVANAWLKDN